MDEKTIKEALRKGERVTLECKRAKAEVPKSVWATYSAFANTIGGLILLGVNEDIQEKDILKRYQIIGVDEPMKIITDFWNTLNSDKVNENILLDNDVEVVNVDGVQIVCIHVPQADWRAKPIYLNGNVYKGTYMPSVKSSTTELSNGLSIELPEGLSIRLSKELSKGLSETAANIYKMIYADNYITRSDIANRIGISVTAVQKHINKLKSLRFIDRDGSTGHGSWIIIE